MKKEVKKTKKVVKKKEKKSGIVVMLKKEEHDKLKRLSSRDGRSESGYMRNLLLNAK